MEVLVQKQMSKQQQKSTQETKKSKKKIVVNRENSKTTKWLLEKFGGKLEEEISNSILKTKDSDFSEQSPINKFEPTKSPILFNPIGNWNFLSIIQHISLVKFNSLMLGSFMLIYLNRH